MIVVICSVCFGGLVSLASIFHQYMLNRNQQLNASIQKRAIEQQQKSLANIRDELRQERKSMNNVLYEDSKEALEDLEDRIAELFEQKSRFLEVHLKKLNTYMDQKDNKCSAKSRQCALDELTAELKQQLSSWDARLAVLQKEHETLLSNHLELSKSIQMSEKERSEQLNALYNTHGKMLDALQSSFSEQRLSLTEMFINSSKELFQQTLLVPAKFMMSFFSSAPQTNLDDKIEKEAEKRSKTTEVEKLLNFETEGNSLQPTI